MSKRPILLLLVCLLALLTTAAADVVYLANGGKVAGNITEIKLQIGPLESVFPRKQIRSVQVGKKTCDIFAEDGTKYSGRLDLVSIQSDAGTLSLGGKSVKAIEIEPAGNQPPPPSQGAVPVPEVIPKPEVLENKLPPQQEKEIRPLLKAAADLRDEYLKRADELADAKYKAIKRQYNIPWHNACQELDAKKAAYAQRKDGGNPAALGELNAAKTAANQIESKIQAAKNAVTTQLAAQRDQIHAYYTAIARFLATGKSVREDEMKKIFGKALPAKNPHPSKTPGHGEPVEP